MTGDTPEGRAFDRNHPLGGNTIPLRNRGLADAESFGELADATGSFYRANERIGLSNHKRDYKQRLAISQANLKGTALSSPKIMICMTLAEKLRQLRDAAGLTQQQVADHFRISAPAVAQWESSEGTAPAKGRMRALAKLYGVEVEQLFESEGNSEVTPPFPIDLPAQAQMPRDVPIYGVAAAGKEEDGAFNMEADIVDYARRPPSLANARDLYGLYIASDSMEPAFRRGDLVYIRRRWQARPGDDVIIQVKPDRAGEQPACFIKRLVRRTATKIIVEQFNPPKQLEFAVSAVIAIHRVLTLAEILGT